MTTLSPRRLIFKFVPEVSGNTQPVPCKMKIEIAMRDQGSVQGYPI